MVRDLGFEKWQVYLVCTFIMICDALINVDHGALPAALTAISHDLGIKEVEMGGLGSLVFLGLVMGSATSTLVVSKYQYKQILSAGFLINAIGLLTMTISRNFTILCFARFLSGFS